MNLPVDDLYQDVVMEHKRAPRHFVVRHCGDRHDRGVGVGEQLLGLGECRCADLARDRQQAVIQPLQGPVRAYGPFGIEFAHPDITRLGRPGFGQVP